MKYQSHGLDWWSEGALAILHDPQICMHVPYMLYGMYMYIFFCVNKNKT